MTENKIQNRIDRLLELLQKYSVEEINELYRQKEVELEIKSFSQNPTVKWSEKIKKRMIQQAKKKRISPSRQVYLKDLIKNTLEFKYQTYIDDATSDAITIIEKIKDFQVQLLSIEFFNHNEKVEISGYDSCQSNSNTLIQFRGKINASKCWKFINSNKFSNIAELLEILDIEDEEYAQIFIEIYELRVFNLMKFAFNSKELQSKLAKENLKELNIEIGLHDCNFYKIFNNNNT